MYAIYCILLINRLRFPEFPVAGGDSVFFFESGIKSAVITKADIFRNRNQRYFIRIGIMH